VIADPVPNGLGDQRRFVEGVEIGEVHQAGPSGPRSGLVGHPPQVQRDGQPVVEQTRQLPVEQLARSRVQQQDPRPLHVLIPLTRTDFTVLQELIVGHP
jgi:hypothetical protein